MTYHQLYTQDIKPGEVEPCATCKSFAHCRRSKLACEAFHEFTYLGAFEAKRTRSKYWYERVFGISDDKIEDVVLLRLIEIARQDQNLEELRLRIPRVVELEKRAA